MVNRGTIWKKLASYPPLYRMARGIYPPLAILLSATLDRRQLLSIQGIEEQIRQIEAKSPPRQPPVVIFDSERQLTRLNWHTATSRAIGWALRLAGQSVVHVVCERGVPQCLFSGAERRVPDLRPPCSSCTYLRRQFYPEALTRSIQYNSGAWAHLEKELLNGTSWRDLESFRYGDLQVGELCVPSVRWLLRRHDVATESAAHALLARFALGSVSIAESFGQLLDQLQPRAVVVYNGAFYAEATALAVAHKRGIPVVTHEIGWIHGRIFLSHGVATRYQIDMPSGFEMTSGEEQELDAYLAKRFSGNFKMGVTRFWPEMHRLSPDLKEKMSHFRQVVSIFTNVIFDTSQLYANTVFHDMFEWLSETVALAAEAKDTLFVIRVHPDELLKDSQETVTAWFCMQPESNLPNVVLIPADEYISSYELIQSSKFVIVYNSTVGLEAMILGKRVICGGETRYLNVTAAIRPVGAAEYRQLLRAYLGADQLMLGDHDRKQARRYLYYTYFRACLDLSKWIGLDPLLGPRQLGDASSFHPDNSVEMNILARGILNGEPFVYP